MNCPHCQHIIDPASIPDETLKTDLLESVVGFRKGHADRASTGVIVRYQRASAGPWQVAIVRLADGTECEVYPDWFAKKAPSENPHPARNRKPHLRKESKFQP